MTTSRFQPGDLVAGRYQIEELLGTGRTAEVYLAEDNSLHRDIVIKVLLPYLNRNEQVRTQFRQFIVRAATLSHPNLARVFDGGDEAGTMFMVSEYLAGGSLADFLVTGRTLSAAQGARLGRDIAGALAYAHANGFVHGALSPEKILFDDEGHARVSDIALAGISAAIRRNDTVAEVRYLSPEQVEGHAPGARSDVYALALILFEAVTGEPAFDGVNPDLVAHSRIGAPLPVRSELGTLDMLLAQAALSDPKLRLDAEQFAQRLGAVVSDTLPFVLGEESVHDVASVDVLTTGNFVPDWTSDDEEMSSDEYVDDVDGNVPLLAKYQTREPRTTIGFRAPSPEQISSRPRPRPDIAPEGPQMRSERPTRGGRFEPLTTERGRGGRRWALQIVALLLVLGVIGGGVAWKRGLFTSAHTVPSLSGLTIQQASTVVAPDGFTISQSAKPVESATVPANEIVSQSPAKGTSAKSGQVITVVLSAGPHLVTLPTSLIGEDCATATQKLSALHVSAQCPSSAQVASNTVPVGRVAEVIYNKTKNPLAVPKHATVTLALSSGKSNGGSTSSSTSSTSSTTTTTASNMRVMPNLVGDSQAQVAAAMKSAGLYYVTKGPHANSPKWTKVLSTVPAAGTKVKYLSTVTLNVN